MPKRAKRVTTHDVARVAGVSQPTVSLVLSNNTKARVSSETRERVLRAAEELGYQPNVIARALVLQRSYALGIIVPDLRNPFFAEIVSGAERVASDAGYAVFLCEARDRSRDLHIQALLERQIDGIMIDALGASSLTDKLLERTNVVLIDEPPDQWPGVASDAYGAGKVAAEHLLSLGHEQFGFIGPATDIHTFRMRERGFVQTIGRSGFRIGSDHLRRVPPTAAGGQLGMRALLGLPHKPTAVFCANDLLAIGALKACSVAGRGVPSEISVMGCDDIELASLTHPELTTVAIRPRELGARAARMLLHALRTEEEEGRVETPAQRTIASRLVVRGTTARVASRVS